MSGPYETERQAIAAVRHIYAEPAGTGAWQDGLLRLLEGACGAAGVKPGAYDHQILVWIAGAWEPQTAAVIAGLITRADRKLGGWESTIGQALADALAWRTMGGSDGGDQAALYRKAAEDLRIPGDITLGPARWHPDAVPGARELTVLGAGDVSTVTGALDVAANAKRDAAEGCPDCADQSCETCAWRLNQAAEYEALSVRLRGGA